MANGTLSPVVPKVLEMCVHNASSGERGGERDMRSEIPLDSDFMMLMINVLGMQ